jgi:tRNA G10  N-methylase Trm11
MDIGMLPPKLAQIMLNIAGWKRVYDPFVWLGTILIESIFMWNTQVFWSDVNQKMVLIAGENIWKLKKYFDFKEHIILQNAKYIHEISFLDQIDSIVTEWYLWEIMTKNNINMERIEKQKVKLYDLYEWFFWGLLKWNFKWNIVISFPFWEISGKYFYFEELYSLLQKYCIIQKLLPEDEEFTPTKSGSLLYKRENQLVGREIFLLMLK